MIGMDGDPTNVHGLQFASNSSAVLHLPIHRTVGDGRVFEVGTSITADDFPLLQLAVEYTVMKEVAIEECFHHRSRRKRVPSGYLFDACACEDKFVFFWIDQLWSTKCRLTLGTFMATRIRR